MTTVRLFETAMLGTLRSKNRIAMPAFHLGFAEHGRPSPALLDFYERRASGGAGVITVGVCNTGDGRDPRLASALDLSRDDHVAPFAELVERIKRHGALAGIQLAPLGDYNAPAWRPDAAALPRTVEAMGEAASRAAAAGFDFVELMFSGGSLLSHILSPAHNQWQLPGLSGSLEERLRIPVEAVRAVRAAIGGRLQVLARIHGHEFLPGGYGVEGATAIAAALRDAGVDAFDVTGGGHRTSLPQLTSQTPPFPFAFLAARIRRTTERPVLTGSRIRTPREAIAALLVSTADFVNVARALVVDPDWPRKAEEGRADEIVPCMACGRCFDQVFSGKPVFCSLNPDVGRAARGGIYKRSGRALVVGSGPAGLHAAWRLHELGYEVTIKERAASIGGRLGVACRLRGREDLAAALRALAKRVARSGVAVETGAEVTAEEARAHRPEVLVLALGARSRRVELSGLDTHPNVMLPVTVLSQPRAVGRDVAIIGAGGVGVELAIHLASEGEPDAAVLGFLTRYGESEWLAEMKALPPLRNVTLLRRRGFAGEGLGRSVRWALMADLARLGVRVIDRCSYERVTEQGLAIVNERGEGEEIIRADTIVVAAGYEPDSGALQPFLEAAPFVLPVGDAVSVGGVGEAIASAEDALRRAFP